jgi:hypothetical protein
MLAAGVACSTTDLMPAYQQHAAGDFDGAVASIQQSVQGQSSFKTEDTLWLLLEQGKILQDAGRWQESNALEKARILLDNLGDKAFISVNSIGNDVAAMQTDDRQLDYVGTLYDRIFLHTTMAINDAMMGNLERAVANVRAQLRRQQEAVDLNAKRLAAIDQRRGEDRGRASGMQDDGTYFSSFMDFETNSGMGEEMKRMMGFGGHDGYADYHAPYGYALGAILMYAAGRDGEAADLARLASDPKLRVQFQGFAQPLGPDSPEVIVLFENGLAPARLDASFSYFGPNGPTKVPIPKIEMRQNGRAVRLRIEGGDASAETANVDSVDGIVVTDFRNALPIIWFRATMQVMLKEVETYVARRAAQNNVNDQQAANLAELGVLMAGVVARNVVKPDLRSWQTLPGEHQMARFPRPQSNTLTLRQLGSGGAPGAFTTVALPAIPGPVLIFVRSTGLNVPPRAYAVPLVHGAPRT